jgi:hypothetical protein
MILLGPRSHNRRVKGLSRQNRDRGDDEKAGTLQSMPTSEREVQGLYKVCTGMDVRGMLQRLYKVYNRDRVIQVIQDLKATDYWRN